MAGGLVVVGCVRVCVCVSSAYVCVCVLRCNCCRCRAVQLVLFHAVFLSIRCVCLCRLFNSILCGWGSGEWVGWCC